MTYTAIVLAGSRPGRDALAEQFEAEFKALIPIAGEPMVRRPVAALLASESVGKIIILAQQPDRIADVLPSDPRLSVQSSEGTIATTMLNLCHDPAQQWPLLVTTADQALLEPATVDAFCNRASGSDLAVGVVERVNLLRRFPQAKRTWLKFRGGAFTGANLFSLGSPRVASAIELWSSAENERKKGWRVIALLGPVVLVGTALRLLSIDEVLARLGQKLGLSVRAVRLSNPLAGVDVDKPEDHALVEAILAGRA